MTPLDKLRHRHEFLNAGRLAPAALRLTAAFARASGPLRAARRLPPGALSALEADLIYCLLRHRQWLAAPLVTAVVADFLSGEYGLPHDVAEALTAALVPVARGAGAGAASHVPPTDDEFLRYICVVSAAADGEAELAADLGLGTRLLGRIKEAVRLLVTPGAGAAAPARFVAGIDARIGELLCELAREQRTTPWALQIHRLRFHLSGIGAPWRELLAAHGARWVYELLLTLGTRGRVSERQAAAKLARLLPERPEAADEAFAAALLTELAAFDLCYPEHPGGARDGPRWQALPLALAMTADAFARNRLNSPDSPWLGLEALNSYYQAGIIRCLPDADTAPLAPWLAATRPLAPPALVAALTRLADGHGAALAAASAVNLLQSAASPWLRKAACDALQLLAAPLPVGQFLGEVARSDPSPAVRVAALRALARHPYGAAGAAHSAEIDGDAAPPAVRPVNATWSPTTACDTEP